MANRVDPYLGFNFRVEIDGIIRAGFRQCSGLDSSQDPVTYREGTDKSPTLRKLPGMLTLGNITLSRGITDDLDLWKWRAALANGKADRRNMSIVLMDFTGTEKLRWNLRNCWCSKWTGPSFDATTNEAAIETLEIAYEALELDGGA